MCFPYLVLHQSFVVSESYESLSWSIEFQQTLPCKDLTKFMYDTQYGRHRRHSKCQNCNEWKWNWIFIVGIICNVRCPKWAERCISALLKVIHPCMDLEVADLFSPAQVSSLHCVNICICSQASQPPQHHHIATMRRTPVSHHHSEHPRWWHHHLTLILNSIYSPITISPCRWCNSNNVNDFHHQQSLPPSSLEHVNKSSRSVSAAEYQQVMTCPLCRYPPPLHRHPPYTRQSSRESLEGPGRGSVEDREVSAMFHRDTLLARIVRWGHTSAMQPCSPAPHHTMAF